jgi:predicted dehydrogenase
MNSFDKVTNSDGGRRKFLKTLGGIGAAVTASGAFLKADSPPPPARPATAKYMGDFAAPKLDKVRVAIIGVGARGSGHCAQLSGLEGVEMVGICDLYEDLTRAAAKSATDHGHQPKLYYGDENLWKKMLEEVKADAVFVVTPWQLHSPMAIAAMKSGAHAFTEVPLGFTEKDLWDVINTSEETGRHCMMMENVNYGREELLYLNMARQGVIGELLHGEAAYIHDLREQMKDVERGTGSWRTYHWAQRNGNLYPTHGLGPVAQYMSIGRTEDTFRRLTSFSSPSKGHQLYAKENFPADMKWNKMDFVGGDMSTAIIKTALGRTIMIQWDETSPRPYTRHNLITGTKGTLAGFPNRMAIEGVTKSHHDWTSDAEFEALATKYEHPLFKRMGDVAQKMGGHGGMDFLMLFRIIECLRTGAPLDQNVYESALWSVVSPLTEKSVKEDGMPQDFPDFTRGNWKTTKPLGIIA